MLMLSYLCFSKDLWSVGCGSAGFDASNVWFYGDPENKWSVKVPEIYLRKLGSTLDITKNKNKITKGLADNTKNNTTIT